jgi:hypothetical protein
MTRTIRVGLTAGLLAVVGASPTQAFFWGRSPAIPVPSAYRTAYYAPSYAPSYWGGVYCVPVAPAYSSVGIPAVAMPSVAIPAPPVAPPWAQPRPAPPSGSTAEPPLGKGDSRAPKITESRYAGTGAATPQSAAPLGKTYLKVGFWNVTGRDVTLVIEGKTHRLPRDRALTIEVPHRFPWTLEGATPRSEEVPASQTSHEIVLRGDKRGI